MILGAVIVAAASAAAGAAIGIGVALLSRATPGVAVTVQLLPGEDQTFMVPNDVQAALDRLKPALSAAITTASAAAVAPVQSQLDSANGQIQTLQGQLTDAQGQVASLQDQVSKLSGGVQEDTADIVTAIDGITNGLGQPS